MEAHPKPRHQYIYTPRYGQRGVLTYAGQQQNGAFPAGVMPGGFGYGAGYPGISMGYHPGLHVLSPFPTYPTYYTPFASGYYNYNYYGLMYPYTDFYSLFQRPMYPAGYNYNYATTAHVYPPGPTGTTTTTYHITNSAPHTHTHCTGAPAPAPIRNCNHGPTREDIQLENRRVATERGAYDPRRIRPADARADDPFWCQERNGEWHLRTYYQIENECYPGRWLMDADVGFLVFRRE